MQEFKIDNLKSRFKGRNSKIKGNKMTKKKKLHELTQKEIARLCNVTQGCVSGWLSGRLTPNLQNGLKLKKLGFPTEIWSDKSKFDKFMQDLRNKKQGVEQ